MAASVIVPTNRNGATGERLDGCRSFAAVSSWFFAAMVFFGCGEEPPAPGVDGAVVDSQVQAPADAGDPLLTKARASMKAGRIDPSLVEAIVTSDDPAHARARRILAAMQAGEVEQSDAEVTKPTVAPTPVNLDADTAADTDGPKQAARGVRGPSAGPQPTRGHRTIITRMSLRGERNDEVVLTLHASSGLLVGLANQPESGVVRLVVDAAGALPTALAARGHVGGVRVTDIRRATDTVLVTIELDPGWQFSGIRRFGGGARVRFRPPEARP